MGNKMNSNIASGVKAQAAGDAAAYRFVDVKGGGELIELMKKANRTKNYKELDERIRDGFKDYMENEGHGKMVHIRELVKLRCAEKGINLDLKNNNLDVKDMEAMTDDTDGDYFKKHGSQYKEICWKLDGRGGVGETPLHVCLLAATTLHADLFKRMLRIYPKLICDIFISDEFYGENMLHMAIVNEDPAMLKFILDHGADYHQRACGNFFTSEDQKATRRDNLEHEWFDLAVNSNYDGYTYWGEYPLGFAACLGQEECVRLLIAKGADPNIQDSNGNTVLHMLVVHDKKDMFDLLYDLGAKLHIRNRQGLTPLTLAAKLARKDMYEHILELDREVYWIFGNVTSAGYPLENLDTISAKGEISTNSAMYHVVYGEERSHLDMIDGVISHLLHEKWKTFAKYRFLRRFVMFVLYFIIFVVAFYFRPGTDNDPIIRQENRTYENGTVVTINVTEKDPCYLLRVRSTVDVVRVILEAITLFGATVYVLLSLKEIYHQGYKIFFQTLISCPSKALFLMANCFVILMVPGRAACAFVYEDVMGVLAILCTAPYFLFFCRGFKIVGPFVVMIYKMIRTDLLRFFTIYLIFVVGFSQAMYVIFRGVESNIFHHPVESMMGMFIMSLGEFADIYESFQHTAYPQVPTIIFVVYMILVTLLLVNMLIAMMGNTYQMVNETQKEWLRQWAKIILVVEQTVTTGERRRQQINYSHPMADGRRALMIRWRQSEKEQAEIQRMKEDISAKQKQQVERRQALKQLGTQLNVQQAKQEARLD